MHIELTSRHGDVAADVLQLIDQKARKLIHIFERVTAIQITVDMDPRLGGNWLAMIRTAKPTMRTRRPSRAKTPPLWQMMTKTPSATDSPTRFHGAFYAVN